MSGYKRTAGVEAGSKDAVTTAASVPHGPELRHFPL